MYTYVWLDGIAGAAARRHGADKGVARVEPGGGKKEREREREREREKKKKKKRDGE